jgi:hypothetical protein
MGFVYQEPYLTLYGKRLLDATSREGWEAIMPLGAVPHGLMLDRIAAMIRSCSRAVFEIGADNGNVWFELGFSAGRRQGIALMSGVGVGTLPDILRTSWLRTYDKEADCESSVLGFLSLAVVPPMVSGTKSLAEASRIAVIGEGDRSTAVAKALTKAGREVVVMAPAAIRSIAEAIEIADSFAVLVSVRPATASWTGHDAIASLIAVGAAFGLSRDALLAAGDGDSIPSDCVQLLVRGENDESLGERVVAALGRARPLPPPSGTTRPRIAGALTRPQKAAVARALRESGSALLDAEPGYGKTTVLTQAADELALPTAWLTLDADWSATELLERLVAATGEHLPSFGWSALLAVRVAAQVARRPAELSGQPQLPTPEAIAELIVRDAKDNPPNELLLVVDDAHKASEEGGRLLAHLIKVAPSWLRIAVAARGAPSFITAASAAGRIPTWRSEGLKFSAAETAAFLGYDGRPTDDERVALLYERSEGWQAALSVIRAWLDAHPDASTDQLRQMARGDRHDVYRVFATDYFVGLNTTIRDDLMQLSLPIRLEPKVAKHLLGANGGVRLRELGDGPYFITEDESGGVFRLHSLFREFLGQRWIEERGKESLLTARSALARWYFAEADAANAYQIACEAEDWATAAAAIEPVIRSFASQGDSYFVRDVLARLPVESIRASRPLWESWVRALSHLGDGRAMEEARGLAATPAASPSDQALADFLFAELRYERGELSDDQMASQCEDIAAHLPADQGRLAVQIRLQALGVKTIHSANPDVWRKSLDEAEELADEAERSGLPTIAAIALSEAGDLAGRIFQMSMSMGVAQLRFARSMGFDAPLSVRQAQARQLLALVQRSLALYQRAFRLAEEGGEPIPLAHVHLSYSRFKTLQLINGIWRGGELTDEMREIGDSAISAALGAAETYANNGILRSVAVALNAASEAASAINDRPRLDEFSKRAEQIALEYGYRDLAESADRIRSRPTAWESYQAAAHPPPLHKWDRADLNRMIAEMIDLASLDDHDRETVRPVLERMIADEVYLDSQREAVCQYLLLLQDKRGPKIGPFEAAPPKWRVTCRTRGIVGIDENRNTSALIRRFASGICANCSLRSPAATPRDFSDDDEEIYRPMYDRFAAEERSESR